MLGEADFAHPHREFHEQLGEEDPEEVFYDCLSEFPLIDTLRTLVEIDQITDLIPVMEAAMLEELEDLQNAAAVTANLLQQTRTAVNNSYTLAFQMSFCRWSRLDYTEILLVTERLDNCRQDLSKLPLEDLHMFTTADLHLDISPSRLPPSSSAYQVLHVCRRALRAKAQSDQQLLQLLAQPDWEVP